MSKTRVWKLNYLSLWQSSIMKMVNMSQKGTSCCCFFLNTRLNGLFFSSSFFKSQKKENTKTRQAVWQGESAGDQLEVNSAIQADLCAKKGKWKQKEIKAQRFGGSCFHTEVCLSTAAHLQETTTRHNSLILMQRKSSFIFRYILLTVISVPKQKKIMKS